ncbi:MAG: protein kinase domain-containing protein [Pyrinomonadaceae bacterium]
MGAVFLAERTDGEFQQNVALKIIRHGFADVELARRFRQERQILASLNHPNIARLLDGGVSADGEPFLAMEYVEGLRIDEYCAEHNLSIDERLKLFLAVCQGVPYAHQHLVVHRDLKPSNILVTSMGAPKLLDFGIAKLLDAEQGGEHTLTNFRAFTPDYAAPEQVRGERVTTASDVYSLGVLLHDLLHGARHSANVPFVSGNWMSERLEGKTIATNLPTNRANKKPESKNSNQKFIGLELKNIIAMAKREEPARRYASVTQFAEDVQRYLDGLPVRAQKDTFTYRAEKFFQRNKIGVAASVLVALSLVTGFTVTVWQAGVARTERDRAERRFTDVRHLANVLLFDIAPKIERLEGSTEARQTLVNQSLKYLNSLAQESGGDAALQSELASAYEKIGELQGAPRKPNLSDYTGAIASYQKAVAVRQKLLEQNPQDYDNRKALAMNFSALSYIHWWMGDLRGALEDSEKALAIYEQLPAAQPSSFELLLATGEAQIDLANTYYLNDQLAKVYPPLQKAIATLEPLKEQNPNDAEIQRLLGRAYTVLGISLSWDGKQIEGEAEMAKATSINESLVQRNPHDNIFKQSLLRTYLQSSQLYEEVNDSLSFEILLKALKVAEDVAQSDALNSQARQDLAKIDTQLGVICGRLKKNDEAVSYLKKSLVMLTELESSEPQNFTYKGDISRALTYLGLAYYQQRNYADALANYEKAVSVLENFARNDSANMFPRRKLAAVYRYIGDTHRDLLAQTANEQNRQTHRDAAKENYVRALNIFLQMQSQNSLTEYDRKYLQAAQAAVQKYER